MSWFHKRGRAAVAGALLFFCGTPGVFSQTHDTVRIKDIAEMKGVQQSQVLGIGLVTGLAGKGDTQGSSMTKALVSTLLSDFGIPVAPEEIRSRNCAIVTVVATIQPFAAVGERLDVHVASLSDASDLTGGILLKTPLRGAEGEVYATAQGVLSTPLADRSVKTVGTISRGAVIEREISQEGQDGGLVVFVLHRGDFSTALGIAQAISDEFPELQATAASATLVEVRIPPEKRGGLLDYVAKIEQLHVEPDTSARVVVDERTGVIVLGGNVRIGPVGISYRQKEIRIHSSSIYAEKGKSSFFMNDTAAVSDFVELLQNLDVKTDTVIEMLKLMDKAGVLYGTLSIE